MPGKFSLHLRIALTFAKRKMLYECETCLIFAHIQKCKRKGQCYKLCRGVRVYFDRSCQNRAFNI